MIGRSSIIRENKKIGEFFSISAGKYITQSRFGRKIKVRFRAAYLEKTLNRREKVAGQGFCGIMSAATVSKSGTDPLFLLRVLAYRQRIS
jgi:hypothetical protein